jgi:beta-galactosidase
MTARLVAALLAASLAPTLALGQGAPPPDEVVKREVRANVVKVVSDAGGQRLTVDGRDFMVHGLNWDYFPIGQNYGWSLWAQPDDVIEDALAREMPLLKAMGANAVRIDRTAAGAKAAGGITPRWVRHLYERYGIHTVLNNTVARYGYTLDGVWTPAHLVDYSNPKLRAATKAEVLALVDEFKGTPGLLMWLLGNENNYGLHWSSTEIEALPEGKRDEARARHLYSLFGEITRAVKTADPDHPVAIANGDVQYLDLIAEECQGLDVFGANVYRGRSMRDLYDVVKEKLGVPVMFTEFGADAFDAKRMREDDLTQARYLLAQWQELYEQSAGKGRAGNAIGGLVFQWSDGWWKYKQEENLDVHDATASWPNGGYPEDLVPGQNNMNEEWWGICAKGPPDGRGVFDVYPRTAYYVLQAAWRLPAYEPSTDRDVIAAHYAAIEPAAYARNYRNDQASQTARLLEKVRVSGLRLSLETYSTGGKDTMKYRPPPAPGEPPLARDESSSAVPYGFDHMESIYADVTVQPVPQLQATVSLNLVGNVARAPIDQLFYEKRAFGRDPETNQFNDRITDRLSVYGARVQWEEPWFRLDGFFRTGHYHWGPEGDFFGLYREANYGENLDIYDGQAPLGVELTGKLGLSGLKVAVGPQLWWGANPAVVGKYQRKFGPFDLALVHQEDLADQSDAISSAAVPVSPTRKTALTVSTRVRGVGIQVGGLWANANKIDETFTSDQRAADGGYVQDRVRALDTLGARAKLTYETGRIHWYAQGAYMGLVADAGPDAMITYTGWTLKDSGSGNQVNALTGVAVNVGEFQISPSLLWQKPLVGPIDVRRTIFDDIDPFAVRANRETVAGELVLTYDPTPATWLWAWDNDLREDAPLAASVGLVYRHQPTSLDRGTYVNEWGDTAAFTGATPARDLWEARTRVVSRVSHDLRLVAHAWVGTAEPTGEDERLVHRLGADLRLGWRAMLLQAIAKKDDYGPYDYHRDFNQTYPLQLIGDLSYVLDGARWLPGKTQQTRIGLRGTLRYLDRFSPQYSAVLADDPGTPAWGNEYELRTYLNVTL